MTEVQGNLYGQLLHGVDPFPGALILAWVRAEREGRVGNKARPAVLSRQRGSGDWIAWGLTTKTHYLDGVERAPAPGLDQVGLGPGFVFGGHAVILPPEDIVGVIWAAPRELILACAMQEKGMKRGHASVIAQQLHDEHVDNNWTWPKPQGAT